MIATLISKIRRQKVMMIIAAFLCPVSVDPFLPWSVSEGSLSGNRVLGQS
jgi:hypothetical protein